MAKNTKEPSFEDKLKRLSEIVNLLEQGEVPLSESIMLYKEGLELTTTCKDELEKAKHEVKILQNGNLEPFIVDVDQSQNHISKLKDEE